MNPSYMAHAVAFATIRMAKTLEHLRKVLRQRNCKHCTHTDTTQQLSFDDRRDRDLFRVLKRSPIPQLHALGLRRSCFDGKAEATRPDSGIGEFPCHSHYAERLARLKQVPIFKVVVRPGRDSNHVEPQPTGHEANTLPTRSHVREPFHYTLNRCLAYCTFHINTTHR